MSVDGRRVGVRDSKDRVAGVLAVSARQWTAFVGALREGTATE